VSVATDGTLLATWLNKVTGANMLQVPDAKMPQGVQDTLAGRTQVTILAIPYAAPHIESGRLKPIAISWPQRLPQYAKVPSIAESYTGAWS
jgi:tripartite-type tricarboxylate transporter receptor subunit TctC